MSKLLVEIYLPAAQKAYDISIPADMYLFQVAELVSSALSQLSRSLYSSQSPPVLCDRDSGKILNVNMTAWSLGLRNGSKLMLI